jgi:hypothetical protein
MRQRSRAIEQSPSCEVARWMPIRARRGVFGSASSVKPGAKAGDGSIQPGGYSRIGPEPAFSRACEAMTSRPGQSRLASLAESLANVMIGFLLALAAQCVVFPLFGIDTTFRTDLAISALFTALSIIRSFLLRRLFEALIAR